LVTGGTGFIGGHIVEQLLANGENVRVLARRSSKLGEYLKHPKVEIVYGDVLDKASLAAAIAGVTTLYHAAAQFEIWTADPQLMLDTANQGTRHVLDAAQAAGVKKVLHTSSGAVFGLPENATVTEASGQGPLPDVYYQSKFESEEIAKGYIAKGLDIVFLNPSNVFGPRDTKPLGRSILQLLNGDLPSAWDANFAIVYVVDVARAHILAAKKAKSGERFILAERNIGYRDFFGQVIELGGGKLPPFMPGPVIHGIALAAEAVARVTKRMPLVSVMQYKSGTRGTRFDGAKAERELGLQYTALDQALRETITWYWNAGMLKRKPSYLS
jgi:dihydroflavonol-4-reductase